MDKISRYRGSMLGLAAGDALGTTLEFTSPETLVPLSDMIGGGPFGLEPGQWTDDTSMALCLADSLVELQEFNALDQMNRYMRWCDEGYLSSTGSCFDIGNTISFALKTFAMNNDPIAGETHERFGGNGSLMRLAPVPLAFANCPEQAIELSAQMSRTTHGAAEPVDACRYYAGLIVAALEGNSKEVMLSSRFCPIPDYWNNNELAPRIDAIAAGSFKQREPPEIRGSGYVVHALEAALWAFWTSDSFEGGALEAVNLGEDADTTGAIYGQLAGAYYGVDEIPIEWRRKLAMSELIIEYSDKLFELSNQIELECFESI